MDNNYINILLNTLSSCNIDEKLQIYNSILGNLEDTLDKGEEDVKKILNTYKEKLIKIISLAGHFSDKETFLFRNIFDKSINNINKNAYCFIPKQLRDQLIVISKRKLDVNDFNCIPNDKKEYDFRCNLEYMYLDLQEPSLDEFIKQAKENPNKIINCKNNVNVVSLGNAIIIQKDELIYIKFRNIYRFIIRLSDDKYSKYLIPLDRVLI